MELNESLKIFKALSDTNRLMIVNALLEKPSYVEEISERFSLAPSTVSFHLKKLEEAGLVNKEKEQYYSQFSLNNWYFELTLGKIASVKGIKKEVQEIRVDNYKKKVLDTFFKEGVLTRMPSQHKKRLIVLEELASMFEPGKEYPEPELDEIIKKVYDDHCYARRLMIEQRFMERNGGIYELIMTPENNHKTIDSYNTVNDMDKNTKKELKKSYKQENQPAGIYALKNKTTGKMYIGKSFNLPAKERGLRMELGHGTFAVPAVQEDWFAAGGENFSFVVLEKLNMEKSNDPKYDLKMMFKKWKEKEKENLY